MTRLGMTGLLLLCACGQQADQQAPSEAPSEAGPAAAEAPSAALPDYLPDYPGSTRVEVPNLGVAGTDSRSGNAIAMETTDSPTRVAEFYRARFAEAGVPVRADTITETGGLMSVARDGEKGAMLTISRIGDKTRIAVIRDKSGG